MHKRISLHQVCFLNASNAAFIDNCRTIGIRNAVLVSPKLPPPGDIGAFRQTVERGGMRIEALNHVFATFPDLAGDGDRASAALLGAIDAAHILGARSVYLLTGGRGALGWEGAAERFSALVAPCLAVARERGVSLLIENAPALYADIHIAHTLADTITLAERAGVGVCIDLFACWAEARLKDHIRRAMPRCGLVQVSDYVLGDRSLPARAVPGDGAIPLLSLLGDILEAGYEGMFDLELLGPRIEAEGNLAAATRAAEQLSALLAKLGA
jgi:sugar phosphate isomerase/epimerase